MFPRKLLVGFLVTLSALVFLMAATTSAAPRPVVNDAFRVVIDPGHGGSNEGCLGHDGHIHEKDITLRLARELREQLASDLPHAEVVLTREADLTMTLAQRVAFANEQQADLFLSIHANASPGKNQSGFETYVLDLEASNLESARTAQRENDQGFAVPRSADPVAAMVRELALTHHRQQAARFASLLQKKHGHSFPERTDRGVRTAPFDVLMGARMPAVLHEVGFLDHAEEGNVISSEYGVERLSAAMSQAVVEYYRQRER
jgi:N-acetylmuramoyl-L-alanine amidase